MKTNREKIEDFANNISVTWAEIKATEIMKGLLFEAGYLRQSPDENIFKDKL